ncbi:unnamed protein product [Amoebophrya sp. A25]|nr:unnamed protein product [Amoebophrya sp. A25]|eukprot:GSA25T00025816001.1
MCSDLKLKMSSSSVRVGSYGAMWGDSRIAFPQLLENGNVDFLVADYLAEFTMGILATQKEKNSEQGWCRDFVLREMRTYLPRVLEKKVRIVVNAGGTNPHGCRSALLELCKQLGVKCRIGLVFGDSLDTNKAEVPPDTYER